MERNLFDRYAADLKRLGVACAGTPAFCLGKQGEYDLQYIPFEYINRDARLVIVGITPGNTQLELAYAKAQALLQAGFAKQEILRETIKAGAFGGPSMKPNLLKMLRHFQFEDMLGIDDVESLWGSNARLLHSTSVVPHAAFKAGTRFNGGFEEVMRSTLLWECFLDCFVPAVQEMRQDALFVGLGPCPQEALAWCVKEQVLKREQVLGAFCHPSSAGGSTTRYYLREIARDALSPRDPVRGRCDWLDQAYAQMQAATAELRGVAPNQKMSSLDAAPVKATAPIAGIPQKAVRRLAKSDDNMAAPVKQTQFLQVFERSGYRVTKTTKKLSEFESPNGQVIYLLSGQQNGIVLMVHPSLSATQLQLLDGVAAVSKDVRFHSNMTRFPKRIQSGQRETPFGREVKIETPAWLPAILTALDAMRGQ